MRRNAVRFKLQFDHPLQAADRVRLGPVDAAQQTAPMRYSPLPDGPQGG
jgi:hypothetical protein